MQSSTPVHWPNVPFNEVRAYFYNSQGAFGVPIIAAGRLHPSVTNPDGVLLSESQLTRFGEALFAPHSPTPVAACYNPRHAFVYRDSAQRVVATVGICLECLTYRTSPHISGLLPDWVALTVLFEELGFPLGRNQNASEMRAMHERLIRTK